MIGNLARSERLRELMVKYRVVLLHEGEVVPKRPGRSAIVSRVPDIRLDCPSGKLETYESTLRLEDADGSLTFRTRLCKEAHATADSDSVVAWAVDESGRRYPASAVDLESRTIHLPMGLYHVEILKTGGDLDPLDFLTAKLIENPMRSIMAQDGPPSIGCDVRDGVQALFPIGQMRDEENYLKKELAFLERLRPTMTRFTERFSGRIKEISHRLAFLCSRRQPVELPERVVVHQLSMLSRVVQQRACSWLQFDKQGITGAVNPSPQVGQRGRGAVEFRIQNAMHHFMPEVHVWTRTGRQRNRPRCLGIGAEIIMHYQKERDPFGMVDVVLNYIDTNKVGAHRRPAVPIPALLEEIADEGRDFLEDLF